jgi:hypothetical protein
MWCGFDENLVNKARVVQGSPLLPTFARVCGKFCSETSHIAAAHGARISIFKSSRSKNIRSSSKRTKTKQASPYLNHTSWKKIKHFSDADIQ